MTHSKLIEDEIILERLTGEPRVLLLDVEKIPTDVVIFCGIPLSYRLFLIIAMSFSAGGSAFNKVTEEPIFNSISKEIDAFWSDIGYTPVLEDLETLAKKTHFGAPYKGDMNTHRIVTATLDIFFQKKRLSDLNEVLAKVNSELIILRNEQYLQRSMDHQAKS